MQKENLIITNNERLEEIVTSMKRGGVGRLHVLADFDRTLTTAFVDGKSVPSLISILRDENYLTPDYALKAKALFAKYHAIEIDPNVPYEDKWKAMDEWWRKHFALLIESGLEKSDLEKAVASGKVKLRDGFNEIADFLYANHIPLVIMSSSGLGSESISLYLKHAGKRYNNVHIICNEYEWDDNGKAIGIREPIIHGFSKYETAIQNYPAFDVVRERKNVILLGDSVSDLGMVHGYEYDNLLSIGFLNDKVDERIEQYKKVFDVVLTSDTSMIFVEELLKEIVA